MTGKRKSFWCTSGVEEMITEMMDLRNCTFGQATRFLIEKGYYAMRSRIPKVEENINRSFPGDRQR